MRFKQLAVKNFRAITNLELTDLQDTVVIAGPNGCGKSCIFDAIRLLKSVYGGYQPNEWQNWFGEFQINIHHQVGHWLNVFQERDKPLSVTAEFQLSDGELDYLKGHARDLLTQHIWKDFVPDAAVWRNIGVAPLASNLRVHQPEVERRVEATINPFLEDLARASHTGQITIHPNGHIETKPSLLLELVFSRYDPQHIGIIDYHGATRNYGREQIGGINLSIESDEERLRQSALYNYSNKYANLKTEMAGSYVRHLLARQANPTAEADDSLSKTLKELFATFFPGKEFLGPQPTEDGRLRFQVRTANGAEHDIDDLSSGEKEVLYGYLRLRNSAPKSSVLLIDEPELHLNPRLMMGLASFYHRHLGNILGNQIWLVTHSDTLIREAVGQAGFSVFHMQPAGQYQGENQASPVQAGLPVERLVMELVGDLAAYRPGAKIVVFEGESDSQFDIRMVSTLFPKFHANVNAISAGSKNRVFQLFELLEDARRGGHLPAKFYAVTDADSEVGTEETTATKLCWDVYHIENYLLEPVFVLQVLKDLRLDTAPLDRPEGIKGALRQCAQETIPGLVAHKIRTSVNQVIVSSLNLRFDPARTDVGRALAEAAERSLLRMEEKVKQQLTAEVLGREESAATEEARSHLGDDRWLRTFRGRDILRKFVGKYGGGLSYESFRDLIIARMRDAEFQPIGMATVLDKILEDTWN